MRYPACHEVDTIAVTWARRGRGMAVTCIVLAAVVAGPVKAAARDLTIAVPDEPTAGLSSLPTPNPFGPDGPPRPLTDVIVDGQTRFLVSGQAEARCPRDRIDFVVGVVDPFRPTLPGDGAFMCHADAVAQGFYGP